MVKLLPLFALLALSSLSSLSFAAVAQNAATPPPVAQGALFSIAPPSPAEMAALCAGTDDLRGCGKKIEAAQLPAAARIAERKSKLLTLFLRDGNKAHFVDVGGVESGEAFAFFSYHAGADAVTLYHNKADRLGFFVVARADGAGSATPAEPVFSSTGTQFLTVDVCAKECENRIALWSVDSAGVKRLAEFATPIAVTDAAVAWTPAGTVGIELSRGEKKERLELALSDSRWIVVDPSRRGGI